MKDFYDNLIILRGGGDLATGVAVRLFNSGFDILILEAKAPTNIRRTVSLGSAVYEGEAIVEGVRAVLVEDFRCPDGEIPVLIDPDMSILNNVKPLALVDCIIAKKNLGLYKDLCDIVIALGPGFEAGVDCHAVVETMRGHDLGRVIYEGYAMPDTGTPGLISGASAERVIHAPADGVINIVRDIGSIVLKGEIIANIGETPVTASIEGLIRGMIKNGHKVHSGMKIADIDPRKEELKNCYTVSDKARSLGGSVLEAVMNLRRRDG